MRFLLGGLTAGLLLNLTGVATAHFLLPDATARLVDQLGPLPPSTAFAHAAMRLIAGFAVVWVLDATRGRIRSPLAAITVATLACWTLAYPAVVELWHLMGALEGGGIWIAGVAGLAEVALAASVGSLVAGGSRSSVAATRPDRP